MDSNYADCLDTRKSVTGYVSSSFRTIIIWIASLQKVIAVSNTEVEYILMNEAVKESICLHSLLM